MFSVKFFVHSHNFGTEYFNDIHGLEAVEARRRLGLAEGNVIFVESLGKIYEHGIVGGLTAAQVSCFPEFEKNNCPSFVIEDLSILGAGDVEELVVYRSKVPTDRGGTTSADIPVIFVSAKMTPQRAVEILWALKFKAQEKRLDGLRGELRQAKELIEVMGRREEEADEEATRLRNVIAQAATKLRETRLFVKSKALAEIRELLEGIIAD